MLSQVVIILLGFISRKVFLDSLGTEYLGINGLMTNLLSAMVLIESGIGISIVYNLYKPLAEGDTDKVIGLVQLYKVAYRVLGCIMLTMSLALYPFLGVFMKTEEPIPHMGWVYGLFIATSMMTYLNGYKWTLIGADQKGYVLARINMCFQVITTIGKIIILKMTHDYILYLTLEFIILVINTMIKTRVVYKRYPYLKTRKRFAIDGETKGNIIMNVKAMFLHNIGGYLVTSTDNLLISAFVGVKTLGMYSNYTMVVGQLGALLGPIIGGMSAGIGNLIAIEKREKVYDTFKTTYFISFWVYSFTTIFLFNLLEPFINWWLGDGLLLNSFVFYTILFNFYIKGMRGTISTFKNKAGLFVQDKYAPVLEGIINLIGSIILIKYFGLIGVFLGTTLSTLLVPFWNQPRIVYKELFQQPIYKYFVRYFVYVAIMLCVGNITSFACGTLITVDGFIALLLRGIVCVCFVNGIYCILFWRTPEFKYLFKIGRGQMRKIFTRLNILANLKI